MSRRVWRGVAAAAMIVTGCGTEAASFQDGASVQETTTTAIGLPSPNASLPLTVSINIGVGQEDPPADWTAGIPSTRFEDMHLTFVDPTAAERSKVWAPLVDRVLDALFEAVAAGDMSYDFTAGIDRWGAPLFTADSDETEEFIRGLFPPDIAKRLEIRRESNVLQPGVATP